MSVVNDTPRGELGNMPGYLRGHGTDAPIRSFRPFAYDERHLQPLLEDD
jgi:hypothetical protein